MYRSQLSLDISRPSTRKALSNCQDMHRNLMKAFPQSEGSARQNEQLLYRIMMVRDKPVLYVLSQSMPDWSKVDGVSMYKNSQPLDISSLREKLSEGTVLQFSLLTSPCKKVRGEGKNSRRVFLKTQEEREEWFARKAEKNGFIIQQLREELKSDVQGKKADNAINYSTVSFEGILRITDADKFYAAFCNGIGPGKAYGMGLLMIAGFRHA